jgi:hypothetical protein
MISKEADHCSAGCLSFSSQSVHPLPRRTMIKERKAKLSISIKSIFTKTSRERETYLVQQDGIFASIDDIAGLDQDRRAADPLIAQVDQSSHPKHADGMVQISM